jgi:uncharacterized metal-binding protein YceD (DUF177 family)
VKDSDLFIVVNRIPSEGLEIDRALKLPDVDLQEGRFPVERARIVGSFQRSGNEVVFRGTVEAGLQLVCSRCATPTSVEVSGECYRVFRVGSAFTPDSEGEADDDSLALTPFDGSHIDLAEIAREQVYLLLPLKPLCKESCAGLCPRCGSNRNMESCGCSENLPGGDSLTLKLSF